MVTLTWVVRNTFFPILGMLVTAAMKMWLVQMRAMAVMFLSSVTSTATPHTELKCRIGVRSVMRMSVAKV